VAGKTVQYMFYDLFKNYTELKAGALGSACFINQGKFKPGDTTGQGNFIKTDLNNDLQQAPVFAFAPLNKNSFIAGGNFYGTNPYEGKYDALFPTIFSWNKDQTHTLSILPGVKGEVRDIKWLNTINGGKMLVVARNNDGLLFFKQNE
jgi:hypothetical protein